MIDASFAPPWVALAAATGTTLVVTWLLARLAPRLGWVDVGDGGRKAQREPLPVVGGMAVAIGIAVAWALGATPGRGLAELLGVGSPLRRSFGHAWAEGASSSGIVLQGLDIPPAREWIGPALLAAFLVGLVDDLRPGGLRPLAKLAGQALAGALLAWPLLIGGELVLGLALIAGALVAMNALNTFDNADGAASAIVLLGLAPLQPALAAPLAGFLPFNLRRAGGQALVGRLPRAILGDAGSHLLGMLLLVTPAAWPVLALPLLDLLRVSVERLRAGQRPWQGDRRHLAHRLERRGLTPVLVALMLALIALPSVWAPHAQLGFLAAPWLVGVGATAALLALAVGLTRRRDPVDRRSVRERPSLGLGS